MEGYVVDEAPDGPTAVAKVSKDPPDLLLLDVMMPGQDGLDVLALLRRTTDVPVILLTAKDSESDRVVGLRLGADDYVGKPFSPTEVAARIASVLRRTRRAAPVRRGGRLQFGGLEIDVASREVTVRGELVEMPAREFELLTYLASAPRQAFSREELLEAVWGPRPSASTRQPSPSTSAASAAGSRKTPTGRAGSIPCAASGTASTPDARVSAAGACGTGGVW